MSDKYKTYEELKEELGNNYDLFMYEINLCLLQKIDKAIEYINENWGHWCSNHCKYATETIEILEGDKEQ